MSSLLHPLQSASQKCRPKHQVLVLQCYPKYQKNVQEIKPNSSELSYLLYYASTRRTKLQKVGAFLEKKTASDVWRQKLGNVQVTLQILTAIIEKAPRDLSLYASSVLNILEIVLKSRDINMLEETLPTWEAYCKNVDEPSLTADQSRSRHYLNLVQMYSEFASPENALRSKNGGNLPFFIRWRTVALRAIRAAVGSDAIAADPAAQLNTVMPVILENLSLENDNVLQHLQQKAQTDEKQSTEIARRRRMSIATVTTVDTIEGNQAMASETTADADKLAEDEVRVLAVRCLKQIFSISTSSTRGQTRLATALTLKFIASKRRPKTSSEKVSRGGPEGSWATSLIEAIARWTPVQDRFVIVVTAMETLVRSPIVEALLEKQMVLADMIGHLLRSDINLIGLSVMDVLLGLVQHMLLLLQLGGRDSKILPHQQQQDVFGIYQEAKETFDPSSVLSDLDLKKVSTKDEATASPIRRELLSVLERCISDLGTHIYYTDQITDMLTAILARLKPSVQSDVNSITAAINDPAAATKAIADGASLQEDPATDGFFSFATARVVALKAVKDILVTANIRKTNIGTSAGARSRVGIQVWEGTQWLLKDEEQEVRFAYVDALLTWLKMETNKSDLLLPKDGIRKQRHGKEGVPNGQATLTKRAVSNASKKEVKPVKMTFYKLLHLAIYDNALDFAENEADLLLLFKLLSTMVERLGVNVVRTGLPMIMALQGNVLHEEPSRSAWAKVNIASLVHGYLWSMIDAFDMETTKCGHEINSQISRRKQYGIWFDKIRFPPVPIDQIRLLFNSTENPPKVSQAAVGSMKPFLDVPILVDEIAVSYDNALLTPPTSPPSSPGRVFSVPTLGFGYGYGSVPAARPSPQDQMPQKVKDEMCGQWSREACIADVEKESTASINGSRTGGSGLRQHLAVNAANGSISGRESPATTQEPPNPPHVLASGLGSLSKNRYSGWSGSAIQLTTSSSRDSTMRVSDLKRALSGHNGASRNESPLRRPLTASRRSLHNSEADSESMVSWNEADDQEGFANLGETLEAPVRTSRPTTAIEKRDGLRMHTYHDAATLGGPPDHGLGDDVPPVPKIPSTLNLPGTWPREVSPARSQNARGPSQADTDTADAEDRQSKRVLSSSYASIGSQGKYTKRGSRPTSRAGSASILSQPARAPGSKITATKSDLAGFLAGIDTDIKEKHTVFHPNNESGRKRMIAPPY